MRARQKLDEGPDTTARSLLFIHEVGYLEKPVFEMHEFPEILAENGWDVRFVDFAEAPRKSRPPKRVCRVRSAPVRLHTVPSVGSGIVRRLIAVVTGTFFLLGLLLRHRPDVVVLYAVPTFGWQTVLLCKILRIPVVYRAIDLSSDIRETSFRRLVERAEQVVARNATIVCPNTNELGLHLSSAGATRVQRVFPGFDVSELPPRTSREAPSVVFMGTLFPFAGLSSFIKNFVPVARESGEVTLRILGNGHEYENLARLIEEENLHHLVQLVGFVPFDLLYGELSKSDVAIIPFEEQQLTHVALPGKVPQYVRAGLPVVSTPLRGLQELLPQGDGVTYAASGVDFVREVFRLLGDAETRNELVRNGNDRLNRVATWDHSIQSFVEVLEIAITEREGGTL